MTYTPGGRAIKDLDDLRLYVDEELTRLSKELAETTALENRPISVAPTRPREGMIVFADGTNWDPGNGAGSYEYIAGLWRPLNAASSFVGDRGDITVSGGGFTWTIDNGVVTNAKLADMATQKVKARGTAGTGAPEDIGIGNGLELDATSLRAKVQMSLTADGSGLKLSGDAGSPGNDKYYGTDSGGTKGFFDFPAAGLQLIDSWTFSSGVNHVDFFNLGGYSSLVVVFESITSPAGNSMSLRVSNDNSTFLSTGGDYDSQASDDSSGTTSTTGINLTDGTGSGITYGQVTIMGWNDANIKSNFAGIIRKTSGSNNFLVGFRSTAEVNNALQLAVTPNNLTGGKIWLYGRV